MFVLPAFLIISFFGTLGAREPDIDINRVFLLPKETHNKEQYTLKQYHLSRTNDYDDRSSWSVEPRAQLLHDVSPVLTKDAKTPIKVHQPRQDPRLFYQSDSYIKEINGKNVNEHVSYIYPGREVVSANEQNEPRALPLRAKPSKENLVTDGYGLCLRCPHDRTLVAKPGSDKVIFQHPRLMSCSGQKAPKNARFVHMYGPKFGSLLEQGSYMVVGRIVHNGRNLHLCNMQVHVVMQGCPTPNYLESRCFNQSKSCSFTCRDPKMELQGSTSLTCGNNMKWSGELPICTVRTWCEVPPPPDHGHLSCKGATAGSVSGLSEGSKCRVHCVRGWRGNSRTVAVCRRGRWTHALTCQPKRNFNH